MKKQLTEKELKGVWSFIVEACAFTEEQNAAIHHQMPMTQEIFNSIMDRCLEFGEETDRLYYLMIEEFPQFTDVYISAFEKEIAEADLPTLSPEVAERIRQNIYARIREKLGEDAI